MPIHNYHQEHEPPIHGDVGDIGCPDLIGTHNGEIAQEIGIDLMARMLATGVGLGIDRLKTHLAHESLDALAVDRVPLPLQMVSHAPSSIKGRLQVLLVDQAHQLQISCFNTARFIVEGGTADPQ
jgi:hypothetical protein